MTALKRLNEQLRNDRDAVLRELKDVETVLREAYPGTQLLGDTLARQVVDELQARRVLQPHLRELRQHHCAQCGRLFYGREDAVTCSELCRNRRFRARRKKR